MTGKVSWIAHKRHNVEDFGYFSQGKARIYVHRVMLVLVTVSLVCAELWGTPAWPQGAFEGVQIIAGDESGPEEIRFERLSADLYRQGLTHLQLNFGPGYSANLTRSEAMASGGRVWAGQLAGDNPAHQIVLTESDGFVFGRANTADGEWWIYPDSAAGHRIMRLPDNGRIMDWGDDGIRVEADEIDVISRDREPVIAQSVAVGSNSTIDIAVFYSQSMIDLWGPAVGARVQYVVALLDQSLIDSDTGLRARLVYLDFVAASETASNVNTLQDLQRGAGDGAAGSFGQDFSALFPIRATKGADIVTIIRHFDQNPHATCGNGYINGGAPDVITNDQAPRGISVVSDWINKSDTNLGNGFNSCADTTFAHEIGHNLGFAHNLEITSLGTGVRPFAHGHRVDGVFRTIMSGSSGIPGEQRANYFSNPDINRCPNGAACGSSFANDPADNALAAREESGNVGLFRDEAPRIVSAVLPITRSVQNGQPATAFATIINPASTASNATSCRLRVAGAAPGEFSYQTTDATNAPTGSANTPVDIPAGSAQGFVLSMTQSGTWDDDARSSVATEFDERQLYVEALCENRRSADFVPGLNTLTYSSSATPVPDIVALAATLANDGRVNVPVDGNMVGIFSIAISNIGSAGTITATADTGSQTLALVNIEICQTDPATGACSGPRAASVDITLNTNDTATFGIFVRGTGEVIANDPARNRAFVRFNSGGRQSGATSVAIRTQ